MNVSNTPLIFGEVLFDCFPDGRQVLGGAPFNVAWNLQALGLAPLLVSSVGDDALGRQIRETFHFWGLNSKGLLVDSLHPTGRVKIELANGEPKFTILPNQAYDNITKANLDIQGEPAFLYHGSLALRNDASRSTLSLLKSEYQCPIFLDVNLRSPWWNDKAVNALIEDAAWLKLNDAELDALFPGSGTLEERCRGLLDRFDLEAIFVTLGKKGAAALRRGNTFTTASPQQNVRIVDTVGAGDAFSSVLLLGLVQGWPLEFTMQSAQDFASAVVGQRGAINKEKKFYETFKKKWKL